MLPHDASAVPVQPPAGVTINYGRRVLGVALLIAANCLLLGFVEWDYIWWEVILPWPPAYPHDINLRLCLGVVSSQFLFLGFWCALAPERPAIRAAAGIAIAGLLFGAYVLVLCVSDPRASENFDLEVARYGGVALVSCLLLGALRPWCKWRLAWEGSGAASENRQFRILDLMVWTAAAVIPLGLLQSYFGTRAASLAYAVLDLFAMTLPVFIPSLLWTVASRRQIKWLVRLLIGSLAGSFLAGIGGISWRGGALPFMAS